MHATQKSQNHSLVCRCSMKTGILLYMWSKPIAQTKFKRLQGFCDD